MRNTLSTFSFYRLFIGQFFVVVGILLLGYSIFSGNRGTSGERNLYILDTSLSMGVEDMGKGSDSLIQSRLDRAKLLILSASYSGEVAVIAYARSPALLLPFTTSTETFIRTIQNISISSSFGGSDPLGALSLVDTLYKNNTSPLHIFLLTDGGYSHSGDIFPPLPPLSQLTIIGIGTNAGGKIPLGYDGTGARRYKIYENKEVIIPYDETFLQKIKKQYNATYIHIENTINNNITESQNFSSSLFDFGNKLLFLLGCISLVFGYFFHPYRTNLGKK